MNIVSMYKRSVPPLRPATDLLFMCAALLLILTGFAAGFCSYLISHTAAPPTMHPVSARIPVNVLAHDTFQRANQPQWGTASDSQQWYGDVEQGSIFSIVHGTGRIVGGHGVYNALLGPAVTNADVVMTASINDFGTTVNVGVVLRWSDDDNWYKALIDGNELILLKRENGITTQLATHPFVAQNNVSYSIRFRVVGSLLSATVWRSAAPQPKAWMLTVSDTDLTSGRAGVRVVLEQNTVVTVFSFLETNVKKSSSLAIPAQP